MGTVSRETLAEMASRWGLPPSAPGQLAALLEALAAEPDPHTTVSDPARALDVHVRDSLVALEVPAVRRAQAIVDIGAGAGFPGLPLAIALPEARVDLVESASRKTGVIERIAAAAAVSNARAVHARAEGWAADEGAAAYDVATARAVAPLSVLVEYAAPLLSLGGTFVAWKGSPDAAEVAAVEVAAAELGLEPLEILPVVPYEGARELHLYLYSKVRETPAKYPRRPGMAAKRPLGAKNQAMPPLT
jgi:16S rRNA (guanine527-N7)-methyltransferase